MNIEVVAGQTAQTRVLDGLSEPFQVRLEALSGRMLSLATEAKLNNGAPVRVEWGAYILLAEVTRCVSDQTYELQIRHALKKTDVAYFQKLWTESPGQEDG